MTETSEVAALVSKEEVVSSDPPEPTKVKDAMPSGPIEHESPASAADDDEKRVKKAKEPSSTSNTTARARSTAPGASSVPPIIPQRSILRKPSREYQQPGDFVGGMAAHKRYYDYPPPPQHGAYHPFPRQYPGPPPPAKMAPTMRPGVGGGGGDASYASHPLQFRSFGYSSGRYPHAHHAYSQHAAAAAAEHYQYQQQYAAAAAAAAAAQYREGQSPRIAMGPGRGPPPPWLGGPGGTVSPLRPPPPRASFKPETYGRVGRRLDLAEEAEDNNDTSSKSTANVTAAADGEGEGQGPDGETSQSKRDSKYDDALLLAEVSKIAETEAHHRKEAEAEAEAEANSSSGGSAASTDGDAAGGIQQQQVSGQEQEETSPTSNKNKNDNDARETTTSKKQEGDEAPASSPSAGDNTTCSKAKEDIESVRRRFSDQAKRGSLASPVVRSIKASNDQEVETGKEEGDQGGDKKQARSPTPKEHSHPSASQQAYGRRYPPNYEDQYTEYYYPPATSYPMPHMSLRMQAGRDHHRRGHSGELFYSPGGPYPISAGGRHPVAAYRHRELDGGGPFDGVAGGDRQERLSRPPPEYTPPSAYCNRNAPRQPSKHVEVTPNSHEESPLPRSKRPHVENQEGDATDGDGSGGSPEPGAVRSTQRRARFDESTERDQEDRDRRRAAAAAESTVKGSGGSKTSAIPPFPSPRWSASVSGGDAKASGSQTKPYLPPPRPSTGSRFPYQDDESRLAGAAGEYIPTVTPRGEETSKPMHTFSNARPAPTPPPEEQQPEGPGWSPYPLNHHRRIPSGGFEFTIRPRDFGTFGGSERGIVSTWGKSASWDNEEGNTDQTPFTPNKVPRTPQKGHRKSLPSVSMDYSDSPPGNAVFTPRSSFDPMAESHRFLPPTPGGFFSDPAEYLDYGDYQYVESSVPPSAYASSAALPPPQMMLPRRQQTPHQQGGQFHSGSPQALAPRQFATPSNSGGSKYPPLSAFQPDGTPGGYGGGYGGKTIIRRKCPWKNFPEVRTSQLVAVNMKKDWNKSLSICARFDGLVDFVEKMEMFTSPSPTPDLPFISFPSYPTVSHALTIFHPLQLEDFLIANRDEYLRHSAMNYTSQQRQYNNRLTERLLELAARHGYVFDEEDFGE